MACGAFAIPRILGTCACCGDRVLSHITNTYPDYRRIHFQWNGAAPSFVSFCPSCAEHEWTPDRLTKLEEQIKAGWRNSPGVLHPEFRFEHLRLMGRDYAFPVQTWVEVDI